MIKVVKTKFLVDSYFAYLIDGAERTEPDGYPIIPSSMVALKPPKSLFQWDRRQDVQDPSTSGMSFYCQDYRLVPILSNPKGYVDKLRVFQVVLGMDLSPWDNMPLVEQEHNIFINLAVTFYYGKQGLPIVPNVRLGLRGTYGSLAAYPKHALIDIGTNGFTKALNNRDIFAGQVGLIIETLQPSGIIVYGPASDWVFLSALAHGIPIYQFDSYSMKRSVQRKEAIQHERQQSAI
jgi:hypothetical protein